MFFLTFTAGLRSVAAPFRQRGDVPVNLKRRAFRIAAAVLKRRG